VLPTIPTMDADGWRRIRKQSTQPCRGPNRRSGSFRPRRLWSWSGLLVHWPQTALGEASPSHPTTCLVRNPPVQQP